MQTIFNFAVDICYFLSYHFEVMSLILYFSLWMKHYQGSINAKGSKYKKFKKGKLISHFIRDLSFATIIFTLRFIDRNKNLLIFQSFAMLVFDVFMLVSFVTHSTSINLQKTFCKILKREIKEKTNIEIEENNDFDSII